MKLSSLIAASGLLISSFMTNATAGESLDALYAAAKAEPALTWYQVPISQGAGERVVSAFMKKYPGLTVHTQRSPAQTHFQKVMQEVASNAPGGDIFTSSVVGHLSKLKADGQLLQYTPSSAATVTDKIPGAKNIDPDGYYFATLLDHVSIVYNTKALKKEDAPKSYKELLDSKWRSKVAVPNPAASGTFGSLTVVLLDTYGESYFGDLAKNDTMVVRSLPDVINTVKGGERALGIAPAPFALAAKAEGQPIDVIYPEEGVLVSICASGILKKSKSPNTAKLFMEFLHSAETSEIIATEFNEPLHDNVATPAGVERLSSKKILIPTANDIKTKLPVVIEAWRTAFGM